MTAVFELPLTAQPQEFRVSISGITYAMQLYWLRPAQCWVLNIFDNLHNPLIMGVPLVTGANLLEQFIRYIGPQGKLFVISDHTEHLSDDAVPDWTNLGITGHCYYLPRRA